MSLVLVLALAVALALVLVRWWMCLPGWWNGAPPSGYTTSALSEPLYCRCNNYNNNTHSCPPCYTYLSSSEPSYCRCNNDNNYNNHTHLLISSVHLLIYKYRLYIPRSKATLYLNPLSFTHCALCCLRRRAGTTFPLPGSLFLPHSFYFSPCQMLS